MKDLLSASSFGVLGSLSATAGRSAMPALQSRRCLQGGHTHLDVDQLRAMQDTLNNVVDSFGMEPRAISNVWKVLTDYNSSVSVGTSFMTDRGAQPPLPFDAPAWTRTLIGSFHEPHGRSMLRLTPAAEPRLVEAAESVSPPSRLVDDSSEISLGKLATSCAWTEVSNVILCDSRRMSPSEHKAVADAVWDDIE